MTALTERTRVVGTGRAKRTVVETVDRWGLVHAAESAEYVPLDYRVRLHAHVRGGGRIRFPTWIPLTACGQPPLPHFIAN